MSAAFLPPSAQIMTYWRGAHLSCRVECDALPPARTCVSHRSFPVRLSKARNSLSNDVAPIKKRAPAVEQLDQSPCCCLKKADAALTNA